MADFCLQCTEELAGVEYGNRNDMRGLVPEWSFARMLCEGCGHTIVDAAGRCVSDRCFERHGLDGRVESEEATG